MNNFNFHNPTRIVFGKGTIAQLAELVPADRKVMLTYGGGSIKKNGVYEQVKKALAGRSISEFGGIEPNPLYETLMECVKQCRKDGSQFLLAVGGGSVLDGTKFIAAALRHEGEPWDILAQRIAVKSAVPLGSVLTLPATGSESNGFAVISRKSSQEKLAFGSDACYPVFSILDPTTTFSLPTKQVRNGIVDAFTHVMEQYATYPAAAAVQDRQAEAILATLVEQGPATLARPENYDARANLVWAATQALNGLIGVGVPQDWATHMIGHEITAFYGLDHAETLAIVLPALLRHQLARKQAKLAQMGKRVFGLGGFDEAALAKGCIEKIEAFYRTVNMPTKFAHYEIAPAEAAQRIGNRFEQRGLKVGEHGDLAANQVREILLAC